MVRHMDISGYCSLLALIAEEHWNNCDAYHDAKFCGAQNFD